MGPRPRPLRSLGYFLVVDSEGYALAYHDEIAPARGETVTVGVTLEPGPNQVAYRQIGELSTGGAHGEWWVKPNEDFSRLVTVQARHPPELVVPGYFLMMYLSGKEF